MTLLFGLFIWAFLLLAGVLYSHLKELIDYKKEVKIFEYLKLQFEIIKLKIEWERVKRKKNRKNHE